ncbi:MAG: FAD-dependent oxidoreductase [Parvularculaceae bacterium]|nr:FAD-dependent oxidoreductase [Parvularculaceae bacterium]
MSRPDVIIAGGGVIGLMTGFALARAGVRAIVVDSGMPAATDAAAGMLAPSFEGALRKAGDDLAAFGRRSLAAWPQLAALLAERTGVDCDFAKGVLSAAFDETEAAAFEAGHEGGEVLGREAVLALEPFLSPRVVAGRYSEEDGQVDPRRVRAALLRAFQQDGGRLLRERTIVEIRTVNGRMDGVTLSDGERIGAGAVIVATGARLPALVDAASGGALRPLLPEGALFPVKGEALALARPAGGPRRVVRTKGAYLCPKSDGRIVVGATEIAGDWSLTTDDARVKALRRGAVSAFAALEAAPEIARWAGLRPATQDAAPIIGPALGADGVILALGCYRNGILLAPATADAVAGLVCDGRMDPLIAAFSAARFNPLGVS